MRNVLAVLGLALAVSSWAPVTRADGATQPSATPAPPPHLTRLSFEGKRAEVTVGSIRSVTCTVPCEMQVVPGANQLAIDGREVDPILVGKDDPVVVVHVEGGSPAMLGGGVVQLLIGSASVAAGVAIQLGAPNCSAADGFCYRSLVMVEGAFFEILGGVGVIVGITFAILGVNRIVRPSRAVQDPDHSASVSKRSPRILPWGSAEQGLHGAVGGVVLSF
jgi:hypothetical protein